MNKRVITARLRKIRKEDLKIRKSLLRIRNKKQGKFLKKLEKELIFLRKRNRFINLSMKID